MANEFYALLGRMRYITRWGLMRNTFSENIQEHSHQVAVLAHALALIRRDILHLPTPDPDRCAVAALYHDASEILTGDLPTPIKYYNPEIKDAYKQVERIAGNRLLDMLPPALRSSYEHLVLEDDKELEPFVKGADKLSAYIKCVEEQKAGNTEFDSAAELTMQTLKAMGREEMDWFIANCLPAFSLNLDQL
ncbi:MAG: 5'-deoxynucleotidase [Candidatus Faecousia sp.]|nr:5'-deoxynucleotidase [Bacillota bacterium]MDY4754473.1 5'-deoxynucleotidase [Candidatus Faecousia sp.]MDY6159259.1 5'-deoxynucleotidase [Candidatus Faecousia sp.]